MVFLPGPIGLAHIEPASIFGNWHGVGVMWGNDGYTTGYPLIVHVGSMFLFGVGSICLIDVDTICPRCGLDMAYRCGFDVSYRYGLNMGN